MTGEALVHTFLAPNHMVRRQIREWQQAGLIAPWSSGGSAGSADSGLPRLSLAGRGQRHTVSNM